MMTRADEKFRHPLPRRIWFMLREPRVITSLTALAWVVIMSGGLSSLFLLPPEISVYFGPYMRFVWGTFLALGGALSTIGCLSGWWWLERAGILSAGTGVLMRTLVVVFLDFEMDGSRLVQLSFLVVVIIMMIIRWIRIQGLQVDPSRGSSTDGRS